MHSLFGRLARKHLSALVCGAAIAAAGCHNNNNVSGFGIGWVTLTDTSGDFASYTVNVDSVTLTGQVNGVITAIAAVKPYQKRRSRGANILLSRPTSSRYWPSCDT